MTESKNQLTVQEEDHQGDDEVVDVTSDDSLKTVIKEGVIIMSTRIVVATSLATLLALSASVPTLAEVSGADPEPEVKSGWWEAVKDRAGNIKENATGLFASDDEKLLAAQATIKKLLNEKAALERQLIDVEIDTGVEHRKMLSCAQSVVIYLEEIGKSDEGVE